MLIYFLSLQIIIIKYCALFIVDILEYNLVSNSYHRIILQFYLQNFNKTFEMITFISSFILHTSIILSTINVIIILLLSYTMRNFYEIVFEKSYYSHVGIQTLQYSQIACFAISLFIILPKYKYATWVNVRRLSIMF